MRNGRLAEVVVVLLAFGAGGCNSKPATPLVVRGVHVNDYEFDYELVPPLSIRADAQSVTITTGKEAIHVADGQLRVNGRPYGTVKSKDHIAVVGGEVTVNGEKRAPEAEPVAAPDRGSR